MFKADFYSHDTHPPLRYLNGHPIYLATVIAALHALVALLDLFLGNAVLKNLTYVPLLHDFLREPWRLVTWAFAERVSVWLLLGTLFTYSLGRRFEMWFGPKFLGAVYLSLILTGSGVALLMSKTGLPFALSGESTTVVFTLFFGTCLLEPEAPFFGIETFPLKYAGLASLGLGILGYAGERDWGSILILMAMTGVMYAFLSSTGMPGRFSKVKSAFQKSLSLRKKTFQAPSQPSRRTSQTAVPDRNNPSKYYEPKIKPKPDLAPERLAVEEVDGILEKIAKSGMNSLSEAEKLALQKASTRLKDTDY